MNWFKRALCLLFVAVIGFNVAISSLTEPVSAEPVGAFDSVDLPDIISDSPNEVGIWLDRGRILVLNASYPAEEVFDHSGAFEAPRNAGLNDGSVEYTNGDGDKITVNFASIESGPTSGSLTAGGQTKTVTLLKPGNAKYDGYYIGDGTNIEMFRYISGVSGCGYGDAGTQPNGDYSENGVFELGDSDHNLSSPSSDDNTYINNKSIDANTDYITAKQHRVSACRGTDKTLSYAGDGIDGGRTIYLAKSQINREAVQASLEEVVDAWKNSREKYADFVEYFNNPANSDSLAALNACADEHTTGTSLIDLLKLLSKEEPGPFLDCVKEDITDPAFLAILERQNNGDYSVPSAGDTEECEINIIFIGDVICAIIKLLFNALASIFTAVIDHFGNTSDAFTRLAADGDTGAVKAWSNLRSVANLLFLIAFLFVIFQYITGWNLTDAYFVKKFIPRMLIAVVLVQASWWIVGEMNHIATDLGNSVQSLVLFGGGQATNSSLTAQIVNGDGVGAEIAASASGIFVLGPAGAMFLVVLVIILLLVLLVCIIMLTIRELLLVAMGLLAPLAFATLALPQLEGALKKWMNMYVRLLLMYPIMKLFIAVGIILGNVLGSFGGVLYSVMGFLAYFLPFFILPMTFKMSGSIMGKVAAGAMNAGKKGINYGKKGKGLYEEKTDRGRASKARKDLAKGIKADRAKAAGEGDYLRRAERARGRSGIRGTLGRRSMFGAGNLGDAEMNKYTGMLEDRETKRQMEEATSRIASGKRKANIEGYTDSQTGTRYAGGLDAQKAFLRDQVATTTGAEQSAAFAQLIADDAGESMDTVKARIGDARFNQLAVEHGSALGDVRADLAGGVTGKPFLEAAGTVEKRAGQKAEAWDASFKQDALATMAARDQVEATGGSAAAKLKVDRTSAFGKVAESINADQTQLSRHSSEVLTDRMRELGQHWAQLRNDPSATPAQRDAVQAALNHINNELSGR